MCSCRYCVIEIMELLPVNADSSPNASREVPPAPSLVLGLLGSQSLQIGNAKVIKQWTLKIKGWESLSVTHALGSRN